MHRKHSSKEKRIIGGFNFILVLWVLISIFRLSVLVKNFPAEELLTMDLLTTVVPLLFLTVLNAMIGISSFFPHKDNNMWLLSVLIITITLVSLNAFQSQIDYFGSISQATANVLLF